MGTMLEQDVNDFRAIVKHCVVQRSPPHIFWIPRVRIRAHLKERADVVNLTFSSDNVQLLCPVFVHIASS